MTPIDFNQRAKNWDANPAHAARNQAIVAALRQRLGLDGTLTALELGCGTGELALALLPFLRAILGTDVSPGMIEQFAAKLVVRPETNLRAVCLDLLGDHDLTETFDLVYSAMMLHHVADVPGLLARVARCLRPGGRVALVDLVTEDGSFHGDMPVPHNGFSEKDVADWGAGAGLRLLSWEVIHTAEKNGRRYPVFLAILAV